MSALEPTNDAPVQAGPRLKLIRVKRKRGAEAPEDLVVEGLGKASKRANTSLAGAMADLGLEQQEASEAEPADAPAGAPARRVRFRKLSTLSAGQLRSMDQHQLHGLLAIREQESQQREGSDAAGPAAGSGGGAQRAAAGLQAGQAARYEHIRRRRGMSSFSITEQLPDPLQQLASVYDVVRHELEGAAPGGAEANVRPAQGGARHSGGVPPPRPSRAQRAAMQYDEGTLLCNYLPMVREYLGAQGRHVPDPQPLGAAASQQRQQQQQQEQEQEGVESRMEGVEGEGDASDGEYVYDLYAAVEQEGEAATGGAGDEGWWELHRGGRAPVVQILEDDSWVVLEQSDVDDSDADSQDSNAEGFFAHDYPDEETDYGSTDDDGHDPEGLPFGQRRAPAGWDSASYGSSDSY